MDIQQNISDQRLQELEQKADDILNLKFPVQFYYSVDFNSDYAKEVASISRGCDNINLLIRIIEESIQKRKEAILEVIYSSEKCVCIS
jgi:hypothetical protein